MIIIMCFWMRVYCVEQQKCKSYKAHRLFLVYVLMLCFGLDILLVFKTIFLVFL